MTDRITKTFSNLKSQNRAGFIPFIMAGDPDVSITSDILNGLPNAGADLIEIGMPFSDPMADGPTIERAGIRARKNNISLDDIFTMVETFRETNDQTPIILMGYYNRIYQYGNAEFCTAASKAGVDGLIIVDLPPEEEHEFIPHTKDNGISLVKLITPTSDVDRIKTITQTANGFVYYVAVAGVTGDKSAAGDAIAPALARIRSVTDLPIAVGFGIKTPADVRDIGAHADAVVVGSALVRQIEDSTAPVDDALKFVSDLTAGLASRL